jgi:hypothetical protein
MVQSGQRWEEARICHGMTLFRNPYPGRVQQIHLSIHCSLTEESGTYRAYFFPFNLSDNQVSGKSSHAYSGNRSYSCLFFWLRLKSWRSISQVQAGWGGGSPAGSDQCRLKRKEGQVPARAYAGILSFCVGGDRRGGAPCAVERPGSRILW